MSFPNSKGIEESPTVQVLKRFLIVSSRNPVHINAWESVNIFIVSIKPVGTFP